jgi:hypothetical protein
MERVFGTLQKRLPQELRLSRVKTVPPACLVRFDPKKGCASDVVSRALTPLNGAREPWVFGQRKSVAQKPTGLQQRRSADHGGEPSKGLDRHVFPFDVLNQAQEALFRWNTTSLTRKKQSKQDHIVPLKHSGKDDPN